MGGRLQHHTEAALCPGILQTPQQLQLPLKLQAVTKYLLMTLKSWDFLPETLLGGSTGSVPSKALLVCCYQDRVPSELPGYSVSVSLSLGDVNKLT